MPEPVSTAVAGYTMILYLATRASSAVSREADTVRKSAAALIASAERSFALFGAKSSVIDRIYEVAAECEHDGWDGGEALGVRPVVVERAVNFIRMLPDGSTLPEVASDPDGSISFDWISSRTRMFSVSVGPTNRLAFAWIDGTDRGHGVARFDGDRVPVRVLDGIGDITGERLVALGAA